MIYLNTKIFNQIRQVQKAAHIDMKTIAFVIHYLNCVKCEEAAIWIQQNPNLYLQGLLEGFAIDNKQSSQLKDLLPRKNLEI